MKETKELKELIYKDAHLLECLFGNIGFNLRESALTQEEMDDITKFKKLIERDLAENISKIVRPYIDTETKEDVEFNKKFKRMH